MSTATPAIYTNCHPLSLTDALPILLSSAMLPHGVSFWTPGMVSTSLDHAMWFHGGVRVDDWFVFVMDSPWTGGDRGLCRGSIYRRDGTLMAAAAQEGLIRYRPQ